MDEQVYCVTLIDLLFVSLTAGISIVGMQHGFFGLLFALIVSFAMLVVLDRFLTLLVRLAGPDGEALIGNESSDDEAKRLTVRAWRSFWPPCDMRDLLFHRVHYTLESMCIASWVVANGPLRAMRWDVSPPVADVIQFGVACCVFFLTGAMSSYGLWILWGRTAIRLGATYQRSSNLSKSVEMVACYLLLAIGIAWIAIAIFTSISVARWFLGLPIEL